MRKYLILRQMKNNIGLPYMKKENSLFNKFSLYPDESHQMFNSNYSDEIEESILLLSNKSIDSKSDLIIYPMFKQMFYNAIYVSFGLIFYLIFCAILFFLSIIYLNINLFLLSTFSLLASRIFEKEIIPYIKNKENKIKSPSYRIIQNANIKKVVGNIRGQEEEVYQELLSDDKYVVLKFRTDDYVKLLAMPMHNMFNQVWYDILLISDIEYIVTKNNVNNELIRLDLMYNPDDMMKELKKIGKEIYWKEGKMI